MTQSWKSQYLCGWVPTAPVWGGAPIALAAAIQGSSKYGMPPETFRLLASTWPVSMWNMPREGNTPGGCVRSWIGERCS